MSEFYMKFLLLNVMASGVSCKNQSQGTISGYVTGGSKTVLKRKDCKHQCSAGVSKLQNACNDPKRCHNCSARYTWSSNGENAKEDAEQKNTSRGGYGTIENF